jgi:hypothetical protein
MRGEELASRWGSSGVQLVHVTGRRQLYVFANIYERIATRTQSGCTASVGDSGSLLAAHASGYGAECWCLWTAWLGCWMSAWWCGRWRVWLRLSQGRGETLSHVDNVTPHLPRTRSGEPTEGSGPNGRRCGMDRRKTKPTRRSGVLFEWRSTASS